MLGVGSQKIKYFFIPLDYDFKKRHTQKNTI